MVEKGTEAVLAGDETANDRLVAAAERVRAAGTLDKSAYLNRLFDFLVARTLAGEPPKEVEIAHEVYRLPIGADFAQDATVRVGVHRLRKKLEELPVNDGAERLLLPRGSYRLVLSAVDSPAANADPDRPVEPGEPDPPLRSRRRWLAGLVGVPAAMVLGLALFAAFRPAPAPIPDPRLSSVLWAPLTRTSLPTVLVAGDQYVVGETDRQGHISRLVQVPGIVSQPTLDAFKAAHKGSADDLIDLNYYELPAAAAPALAATLPIATAAVARGAGSIETIANSRLPTDVLSAHNIVYVGLLSGLRDLGDPIFEGSGFTLATNGDALVDRANGKRYESNWSNPADDRVLARDYAYLASMPGPSGTRMIVVAGTRDPALAEAAQIAANGPKLAALASRVGHAAAFEALYEVRTFGPSNYASQLVIARPMRAPRAW